MALTTHILHMKIFTCLNNVKKKKKLDNIIKVNKSITKQNVNTTQNNKILDLFKMNNFAKYSDDVCQERLTWVSEKIKTL